MPDGVIPTRDQAERIGRVVSHVERTTQLLPPLEKRVLTGSNGSVPPVIHQLYVMTNALHSDITGDFTINLTVNGVAEDITINISDDPVTIESKFDAHSEYSSGDVQIQGTNIFRTGFEILFPDIDVVEVTGLVHNLTDSVSTIPINIRMPRAYTTYNWTS